MKKTVRALLYALSVCAVFVGASVGLVAADGVTTPASFEIGTDTVGTIMVNGAVIVPKGSAPIAVDGSQSVALLSGSEQAAVKQEAFQELSKKAGLGVAAAGLSVEEKREVVAAVKSNVALLKEKAYRFGRLTMKGIKDALRSLRKLFTKKNLKFAAKILLALLLLDGAAYLITKPFEGVADDVINQMGLTPAQAEQMANLGS